MLCGEIITHFIATDIQAAQRCISDRRKDGLMYTIELAGDEPTPYVTAGNQ